jgi:hypothetical protein
MTLTGPSEVIMRRGDPIRTSDTCQKSVMTISTNNTPQYMNNDSFPEVHASTEKIGMNMQDSVYTGPSASRTLNCLSTLDKNVNKIGTGCL